MLTRLRLFVTLWLIRLAVWIHNARSFEEMSIRLSGAMAECCVWNASAQVHSTVPFNSHSGKRDVLIPAISSAVQAAHLLVYTVEDECVPETGRNKERFACRA